MQKHCVLYLIVDQAVIIWYQTGAAAVNYGSSCYHWVAG